LLIDYSAELTVPLKRHATCQKGRTLQSDMKLKNCDRME
jgi:hypothetical protein